MSFRSPRDVLRASRSLILAQREHGSTAVAPCPGYIGVNHAGARANVSDAPAGILARVGFIIATPVIFDLQLELIPGSDARAHLHSLRVGMTTDVAQRLLGDSVNLN